MPRSFIFGVLGVALLSAGAASADVCSDLQQQYLASSSTNTRGAVDVAALNQSLAVAQQAARANNCTGGFFFGPRPAPYCPQILAEVNRLQASIRQADAGSGGGTGVFGGLFSYQPQTRSPREQLRGVLLANGCPIPQGSAGGYRTLCVRTCDGYYFPIGYGVSSAKFQADEQTCQAMYPNAGGAELFVMPSNGDVADAAPVDGGKRYGSQPYAFAYRAEYSPMCVAQLQAGVASLEAVGPASAVPVAMNPAPVATPAAAPALVPLPRSRPSRYEDPETQANAAGDFHARPAVVAAGPVTGPFGVRVVGADYYNLILQQQAVSTLPGINAPQGSVLPQ